MYAIEKIKLDIAKNINQALKKIVQASDLVYPPSWSDFGDISFNCFFLMKKFSKPANKIAENIVSEIVTDNIIIKIEAAGPWVNFILDKGKLTKDVLKEIGKLKNKYGENKKLKSKKIMVEFAHPNPFKSFHIGHLRNILLGESIVRLLEAAGAKIIRTNYQGDAGLHIAKCLWAFQKVAKSEYPTTADEKVALLGKCYSKGAVAYEKNKPAQAEIAEINKKIYSREDKKINQLWELGKKWSLEKFHEIYKDRKSVV